MLRKNSRGCFLCGLENEFSLKVIKQTSRQVSFNMLRRL
jgi:hypothetical protein